jgi:hypothetical protein
MTVGYRSKKIDLGTCFPVAVYEKNVWNELLAALPAGIYPSGWMPCSKQNSYQEALAS